MKQIQYTGSSKLISRIVHLLNRKAPLPLDGDGDAVWGTNGQVLTTDGNGNTSWTTPQGGGGDVTDVEVNGTSVVNAQGVAEVTVPTKTSDLNNDSGFIDSTDLSTALGDYTPTASLASVATSGDYDDLTNKPSIPTVGDGTITIQKNGSTVDTFTTNQSANKTVNITVTEGHTIWNRIKTALTARGKLWFADASVSDVSADDATKVEVVTELASETAFDNLATDGTADGVYCFPDSGEEYLTADNVGYGNTSSGLSATSVQGAIDEVYENVKGKVLASVTADGVKTYEALFNELYNMAGSDGGIRGVIKFGSATYTHQAPYVFANISQARTVTVIQSIMLASSGSSFNRITINTNGTAFSYRDGEVPGAGGVITLYK